MSSIKPKIIPCIDCVEQGDNEPKPTTAKRCEYHYKIFRAKVNAEKAKSKSIKKPMWTKSQAVKKAGDTSLGNWFKIQIENCPPKCEECGVGIWKYINMGSFWPSTLIAHILPKKKSQFPEVATHPNNRMFYCPSCHENFDKKGESHIIKMKSLPLIKERLSTFIGELSESQQARVKDYLK